MSVKLHSDNQHASKVGVVMLESLSTYSSTAFLHYWSNLFAKINNKPTDDAEKWNSASPCNMKLLQSISLRSEPLSMQPCYRACSESPLPFTSAFHSPMHCCFAAFESIHVSSYVARSEYSDVSAVRGSQKHCCDKRNVFICDWLSQSDFTLSTMPCKHSDS